MNTLQADGIVTALGQMGIKATALITPDGSFLVRILRPDGSALDIMHAVFTDRHREQARAEAFTDCRHEFSYFDGGVGCDVVSDTCRWCGVARGCVETQMDTHKPEVWFREHDGTIRWRCYRCGASLGTSDEVKAMLEAEARICPSIRMDYDRPNTDQLGYEVRAAWVAWAKTQEDPKPSWLVPYQSLGSADRAADRKIGEAVMEFVLRTLLDWRRAQSSEGIVCAAFGIDRMAWRELRDELGLTQES
jgi:hypothetical protein